MLFWAGYVYLCVQSYKTLQHILAYIANVILVIIYHFRGLRLKIGHWR